MENMEKVLYLLDRDSLKIITTTERFKLPGIFSCDRVFHIIYKGNVFYGIQYKNILFKCTW